MPTIAKLNKPSGTRYKAIIRHNGRTIKTKTFRVKRDAQTWAKRIEGDLSEVEALGSPGARILFKKLCSEYLDQWSGHDGQISRVKYWSEKIGDKKLTDIDSTVIREVLEGYRIGKVQRWDGPKTTGYKLKTLDKPRSNASYNRMKAAGSALMKYAVNQGYLPRNAFSNVPALPENNKRQRYLSNDERIRLLAECKKASWDRLYLLVLMALTTGCRQGELLSLTWDRIDFKARTAYLPHTKNGDVRVVPIPKVTLTELTKYREVGSGLVFPSTKRKSKPFEFRKLWKQILKRAEIHDFRFHDLRHSCASMLVNNGENLYVVGQILGHRNVQTTSRYAHLSIETKQNAIDNVMDNLEIASE